MKTRPKEIDQISCLLKTLGFQLNQKQPHISGERFLASPDKLVLVGRKTKNNLKVIIKMSHLAQAKKEIKQERKIRQLLTTPVFLQKQILLPQEVYFGQKKGYQILVTEYLEQKKVFVAYPLKKQLSFVLHNFKVKEKLNQKNNPKLAKILDNLPSWEANTYLEKFKEFRNATLTCYQTPGLKQAMASAFKTLKKNQLILKKYSGYLVHTDFAPHNFRLKNNKLYTLDCSAFVSGNKYEELARFLNYMIIHQPFLEKELDGFIARHRHRNEYLDLKLMRLFKIGHLLQYYTQALTKTDHDLLALTIHRVEFWEEVLRSLLQNKSLDQKILQVYLKNRDHLRSPEEKKRQKEFARA